MKGKRFTNTFSLDEYMKCIVSGFFPAVSSEEVSLADAKFEFVMLALRTAKGISFADYSTAFGSDFTEDFAEAIKKTERYLERTETGYKIKDEYLYVQNSVLMPFLETPVKE